MQPTTSIRSRKLLIDVLTQFAMLGGLFLSLRMAVVYMDPYREQREQVSALNIKEIKGQQST